MKQFTIVPIISYIIPAILPFTATPIFYRSGSTMKRCQCHDADLTNHFSVGTGTRFNEGNEWRCPPLPGHGSPAELPPPLLLAAPPLDVAGEVDAAGTFF